MPSEPRSWPCSVCRESLADAEALWLHYRQRHPQQRPLACELCPARFGDAEDLVRHRRSHARTATPARTTRGRGRQRALFRPRAVIKEEKEVDSSQRDVATPPLFLDSTRLSLLLESVPTAASTPKAAEAVSTPVVTVQEEKVSSLTARPDPTHHEPSPSVRLEVDQQPTHQETDLPHRLEVDQSSTQQQQKADLCDRLQEVNLLTQQEPDQPSRPQEEVDPLTQQESVAPVVAITAQREAVALKEVTSPISLSQRTVRPVLKEVVPLAQKPVEEKAISPKHRQSASSVQRGIVAPTQLETFEPALKEVGPSREEELVLPVLTEVEPPMEQEPESSSVSKEVTVPTPEQESISPVPAEVTLSVQQEQVLPPFREQQQPQLEGGPSAQRQQESVPVSVLSSPTHTLTELTAPAQPLVSSDSCAQEEACGLRTAAEKVFDCSLCPKKFSRKRELIVHTRIHARENPFECSYCPKTFKKQGSLMAHVRTHTGEKTHSCPHCSRRFRTTSHLKGHLMTHSGEKPHQCTYCHKKFARYSDMKIHKRRHTGEKPFKCEDCPLRFARGADLKRHTWKHKGEKPFKCEDCSLQFACGAYLKRHTWKHKGERPHKCQDCPMRFVSVSDLKGHTWRHTGEKPFKCEACSMRFTRCGDLRRHTTSQHQREQLLKCSYCSKTFCRPDRLKRHQRTHISSGLKEKVKGQTLTTHGRSNADEKPFRCSHCRQTFPNDNALMRHLMEHIAEIPDTFPQSPQQFEGESSLHSADPLQVEAEQEALTSACSPGESCSEGEEERRIEPLDGVNAVLPHEVLVQKHADEVTVPSSSGSGKPADFQEVEAESMLPEHKPTNVESSARAPSPGRSSNKPALSGHLKRRVARKSHKRRSRCHRNIADKIEPGAHTQAAPKEKTHGCPHCTEWFSSALRLTVHLRSHTGWESNECSLCWQTFPNRSELKEHARTHVAVKPFTCRHCSKRFGQKASLRAHLRTHTE